MQKTLQQIGRKIYLFFNNLRFEYHIRKVGNQIKILIPERHRRSVRFIKYLLTIIALLSALIVFSSVWAAFIFGLVVFLLTLTLEKIAFAHPFAFIHPLPDFDLDPDKWVGVGFGYAAPPRGGNHIPLVSMMITDLDYAKKLTSLFLKWTHGHYKDEQKNVQITVVVTKPNEYIFLCYPNFKKPVARRFFQSARDRLKNKSLEDEITEHHIALILGKRCRVGAGSYFHQFRSRYRPGVPIAFEFLLPPFNQPRIVKDLPTFIFFDFSIKDKSELTRKDLAFEAVWTFSRGGKWQGPDTENEESAAKGKV